MSETKQQEATKDEVKNTSRASEATGAPATDSKASTDAPADRDSGSSKPTVSTSGATKNTGSTNSSYRGSRRSQGAQGRRDNDKGDKRNPRRSRRGGRREERSRPEFDQKIVSIRRVTRVMAGGRRFSFSVSMVIGDKKGKVGVGIGKAGDTQLAIEKAIRNAKKNMITVPMDSNQHIPHDVHTKYSSSEVMIIPAAGRGLVAGSSVRTVLELAGVKDVTAKLFSRSKNKLNNARATIEALKQLKS